MTKLAVFVSGGGTDLQSLIDAVEAGSLTAQIALVVASKPDIFALERARLAGIKSKVFQKRDYESLSAMFDALIIELRRERIDYIVLAGYLSILTPNIVSAYRGKIINIHPSLIPDFCGDGFYGMRVHEAVIASGAKRSGATVHFVDEGTDTGAIIAQASVPVFEDDTAETLQKRVLELEHKLLPVAVQSVISGSATDDKLNK